jgi:hypothetical protein
MSRPLTFYIDLNKMINNKISKWLDINSKHFDNTLVYIGLKA